jgi:hypothetical protein
MTMNARDEAMMAAIGTVLTEEVEPLRKRVEQLERKLDELEFKQGQFHYCGTWSADQVYFEGNFCTHDGSLWHANRQTTQQPGNGSPDFTLVAKRGKDGASRQSTAERTHGL